MTSVPQQTPTCARTTCPCCGHPLDQLYCPTDTSTEEGLPEKIALLDKQIHRMEAALQQHRQERSILSSRVNTVQAKTRNIPIEILSHILQFTCPPVEFFNQPQELELEIWPPVLEVAGICHLWRQITMSLPNLWTTLSLNLTHNTMRRDATMMRIFFENANGRPLSLKLSFRFFDPNFDQKSGVFWEYIRPGQGTLKTKNLPQELVLQALNEHASRIKVLQIDCMPGSWISDIEWKNFVVLEDLRLHWDETSGSYAIDFLPLPYKIQTLSIRNLYESPPLISHTNTTILKLDQVALMTSVPLVLQCPNLVKFSAIGHPVPGASQDNPQISETVEMKHLEELEWEWSTSAWSSAFLRYIKFPALKILRWRGICDAFQPPVLTSFFDDLPKTMTRLEVVLLCDGGEERLQEELASALSRMLYSFPNIVNLGVEILPQSSFAYDEIETTAQAVMDVLLLESHSEGDHRDFVPSLKCLCFRMQRARFSSFREPVFNSSSLTSMLTVRGAKGLKDFKLIWDASLTLLPEPKQVINDLVTSGLSIEIIQDSKRIDIEY